MPQQRGHAADVALGGMQDMGPPWPDYLLSQYSLNPEIRKQNNLGQIKQAQGQNVATRPQCATTVLQEGHVYWSLSLA